VCSLNSHWLNDCIFLLVNFVYILYYITDIAMQLSNKTRDAVLYSVRTPPWSTNKHCQEEHRGSYCDSTSFSSITFKKSCSTFLTLLNAYNDAWFPANRNPSLPLQIVEHTVQYMGEHTKRKGKGRGRIHTRKLN